MKNLVLKLCGNAWCARAWTWSLATRAERIMPIYDAMLNYPIHHVLVRHEQGAAHMADGYARASGKVGVAMATSGPGATNLVTGISTAMMDSSPIVCITGQVHAHLIGGDAFPGSGCDRHYPADHQAQLPDHAAPMKSPKRCAKRFTSPAAGDQVRS